MLIKLESHRMLQFKLLVETAETANEASYEQIQLLRSLNILWKVRHRNATVTMEMNVFDTATPCNNNRYSSELNQFSDTVPTSIQTLSMFSIYYNLQDWNTEPTRLKYSNLTVHVKPRFHKVWKSATVCLCLDIHVVSSRIIFNSSLQTASNSTYQEGA